MLRRKMKNEPRMVVIYRTLSIMMMITMMMMVLVLVLVLTLGLVSASALRRKHSIA